MSAAGELQAALYAALSDDADLGGLIGPGRIFDRLTVGGPLPAVHFERMESADWSTASEDGEEHRIVLAVWSGENGKREAQEIAAAVRNALHDRPFVLADHHLINLRLTTTLTVREDKTRRHKTVLEFRAVTEPR